MPGRESMPAVAVGSGRDDEVTRLDLRGERHRRSRGCLTRCRKQNTAEEE
jgi:hypothetical protein